MQKIAKICGALLCIGLFAGILTLTFIIRSGAEVYPTRYTKKSNGDLVLKTNAAFLRRLPRYKRHLVWFILVKPGGAWDYKLTKPYPGQKVRVGGKELSFMQFGNFNYGYTGHALGIPRPVLKLGAGAVNVLLGQQRGPWLDAPHGPRWIDRGYDYFAVESSWKMPKVFPSGSLQ